MCLVVQNRNTTCWPPKSARKSKKKEKKTRHNNYYNSALYFFEPYGFFFFGFFFLLSITTEEQTNDNESKYGSKIVVSLDRLPNERLKRNVVRSRMDLIGKTIIHNRKYINIVIILYCFRDAVSIGGTLSLFLGVSVLSIVEIIYYFIVWTRWRPMRAVMNNAQQSAVKIKKRQVKNVNRLPFLHWIAPATVQRYTHMVASIIKVISQDLHGRCTIIVTK